MSMASLRRAPVFLCTFVHVWRMRICVFVIVLIVHTCMYVRVCIFMHACMYVCMDVP